MTLKRASDQFLRTTYPTWRPRKRCLNEPTFQFPLFHPNWETILMAMHLPEEASVKDWGLYGGYRRISLESCGCEIWLWGGWMAAASYTSARAETKWEEVLDRRQDWLEHVVCAHRISSTHLYCNRTGCGWAVGKCCQEIAAWSHDCTRSPVAPRDAFGRKSDSNCWGRYNGCSRNSTSGRWGAHIRSRKSLNDRVAAGSRWLWGWRRRLGSTSTDASVTAWGRHNRRADAGVGLRERKRAGTIYVAEHLCGGYHDINYAWCRGVFGDSCKFVSRGFDQSYVSSSLLLPENTSATSANKHRRFIFVSINS